MPHVKSVVCNMSI